MKRRVTSCWPRVVVMLLAAACSGCSGIQSALDPHGPHAAAIAQISWVMFAGATLIFILVIALLGYVLVSRPENRPDLKGNAFIVGGGVILPVVTLSALLIHAMFTQRALVAEPDEAPLVIDVIGHQWWWEVIYREGEISEHVTTANELHIPAGRPVELRLSSRDVIHTFWVPNLAGKLDMIPGHVNTLYLEADTPGLFRGQCNEFCGDQHALMNIHVVSETAGDFEQWLSRQREKVEVPKDPWLKKGHDAFMQSGCALCHAVRGTPARGQVAPDLTHFASRHRIATFLDNNLANREAWILSAQHLKPGTRMPSYRLDSETLHAMAAWLGTLE